MKTVFDIKPCDVIFIIQKPENMNVPISMEVQVQHIIDDILTVSYMHSAETFEINRSEVFAFENPNGRHFCTTSEKKFSLLNRESMKSLNIDDAKYFSGLLFAEITENGVPPTGLPTGKFVDSFKVYPYSDNSDTDCVSVKLFHDSIGNKEEFFLSNVSLTF